MEVELISKKLESLEDKYKNILVSLKGSLKGTKITEEDIKMAGKSLFHSL